MYHVENLVEGYWRALSVSQEEADNYKAQAANASCNSGIPCMFTETVVFETDPSKPSENLEGYLSSPFLIAFKHKLFSVLFDICSQGA